MALETHHVAIVAWRLATLTMAVVDCLCEPKAGIVQGPYESATLSKGLYGKEGSMESTMTHESIHHWKDQAAPSS